MANIADFACQLRSRWFVLPQNGPFVQIAPVAPKPSKQNCCGKQNCVHTTLPHWVWFWLGDIVYVWLLILNAQSIVKTQICGA